MKIAIHKSEVSVSDDSYTMEWIAYCEKRKIPFKIVDCYKNDIIYQLYDCDALMWHFHHAIPKDIIFAKQLFYALESVGKYVFPDFHSMWHFNDKIGQKYLLEAIGAPLVPTKVFYSKVDALNWVNETNFPKVFKLRGGAGSQNVKKVRTKTDAIKLVKKAFRSGFSQHDALFYLKEAYRKYKLGVSSKMSIFKKIVRLVYKTEFERFSIREKKYIYFQDFIPDNDHDIRVVVIDKKAFAIKRMVRANDFRASGSGVILYEKELFDTNTIKLSFDIAEKLKTQCVVFDFVFDKGNPMIIEISYGTTPPAYKRCPGFWDENLNFHEGEFNFCDWMVEKVLIDLELRKRLS